MTAISGISESRNLRRVLRDRLLSRWVVRRLEATFSWAPHSSMTSKYSWINRYDASPSWDSNLASAAWQGNWTLRQLRVRQTFEKSIQMIVFMHSFHRPSLVSDSTLLLMSSIKPTECRYFISGENKVLKVVALCPIIDTHGVPKPWNLKDGGKVFFSPSFCSISHHKLIRRGRREC